LSAANQARPVAGPFFSCGYPSKAFRHAANLLATPFMSAADHYSLAELSLVFSDIGAQLAGQDSIAAVQQLITELAAERIPGAEFAGITVGREGQEFATVAATDDLVNRTDAIQYELRSGPCVDVLVEAPTFNARDLREDPRWPEFGHRAAETTGILSMLSMRLHVETDNGLIAGLNTYSRKPGAFDEVSETIATLIATHGALAVGSATAREKARNLLTALQSSREIGMAIGIIMALHKVTQEQAFDLLRVTSQHTHRRVAELAVQVIDTGALPEVPTLRPRS
jgi:hypothetical protein